jgi:thiamine biosynthesis lipoprotein
MKSRSSEIRRARPLLGTLVEISAAGPEAATGIEAAFREVEAVQRLMSFHNAQSNVSRINSAAPGETLQVNWKTYEVLACAQLLSRLSAGAFDVTVGGKLVEEGFLPRPPRSEACDTNASFEDIVLLPNNSLTLKRRAWIDLGGIAKGYAVDRAVIALKKSGVTSGIVNAGGDLYVLNEAQPIHVRHPEDPSVVLRLGAITNAAVASSSGVFNVRCKSSRDPLVDLRRNDCVTWKQGITVIAPSCMIADALTKVVRLAPVRATTMLSHFSAQGLIIDRRGVRIFYGDARERKSTEFLSVAPCHDVRRFLELTRFVNIL